MGWHAGEVGTALLWPANFILGHDATLNTEIHKKSVRIKAPNALFTGCHENIANVCSRKYIYSNKVNMHRFSRVGLWGGEKKNEKPTKPHKDCLFVIFGIL